jgi:hypothetical protein
MTMPPSKASERVKRGMTDAELVAIIEESAQAGAWRASAWLLEWRRARGREEPLTPQEPPQEPDDPFADVVDIRKRRRPR